LGTPIYLLRLPLERGDRLCASFNVGQALGH
jgi:hypothetical protein